MSNEVKPNESKIILTYEAERLLRWLAKRGSAGFDELKQAFPNHAELFEELAQYGLVTSADMRN